MKKRLTFVYLLAACLLLFSVNAAAYIDPSAMTYIIQIIAGVAIAAGAAFGFYFRKIKRAFSRIKGDRTTDNWEYDETDDDEFGMGDYPVLPGDEWEPGEQTALPADGAPADDTFAELHDKYDEAGCDAALENLHLRSLLAQERAKVELLTKQLEQAQNALVENGGRD